MSPQKTSPLWAIAGGLLFVIAPLMDGIVIAGQFWLILLLPFVGLFLVHSFGRFGFKGLVPSKVSLFPTDHAQDIRRKYWWLIVKLSIFWLTSCAITLVSIVALKGGIGDQWNPFARTIHLGKSGPNSEYGIFDITLFMSGFFASTGFVWLPMYVLFEWLSTRKKVRQFDEGTHA